MIHKLEYRLLNRFKQVMIRIGKDDNYLMLQVLAGFYALFAAFILIPHILYRLHIDLHLAFHWPFTLMVVAIEVLFTIVAYWIIDDRFKVAYLRKHNPDLAYLITGCVIALFTIILATLIFVKCQYNL